MVEREGLSGPWGRKAGTLVMDAVLELYTHKTISIVLYQGTSRKKTEINLKKE